MNNLIEKIEETALSPKNGLSKERSDLQSRMLTREYENLTADQRTAVDNCFVLFCGWSIRQNLAELRKEEMKPDKNT